MSEHLPIDVIIPDLLHAVQTARQAVVQAPPGAGKTTRVPLALWHSGQVSGRIVMLEPRRLAARAAAQRMAESLGQKIGQNVGYRIRGEAKLSSQTMIEVVTEGILTKMLQSDPALDGVGAIIFDEFHERSLNADLGLALALEVRQVLRPDLVLIVMSATLDAAPVAALMGDAPILTANGRMFAVETRWLPRPLDFGKIRFETAAAQLVVQAAEECADGDILVFLPGEGEIRRVTALLQNGLQNGLNGPYDICPLFGAMDFAAQQKAVAPAPQGRRKVVLATSIAQTSLTIPDVRVVVDTGRARRACYDAPSGMARLVTERATKAEAEQRRGRAGRVAAGICYRMWTKGEEGAMAAFPSPEVENADLTALALELALWGSADLPFLTPPHAGMLAEARALLQVLEALDEQGRITDHGRALAALPLHPRLGHMVLQSGGGRQVTLLAALLADRDPLRGAPPDLALRMGILTKNKPDGGLSVSRAAVDRILLEAKRLYALVPDRPRGLSLGQCAALAYPDRVGLRRKGDAPRWILSGGKGAAMAAGLPLSSARLLVATDLDGDLREAHIRQAVTLSESELREIYGSHIIWHDICEWSRREGRIIAQRREMFGALVLDHRIWHDAPPDARARAARDGLRQIGISWQGAALRLRSRIMLCRSEGMDLPDPDDEALLGNDALLPFLQNMKTESDLRGFDMSEPLRAMLGWQGMAQLDGLAPAYFETPLGRKVAIDYSAEFPMIEVRLQEMFGVTLHPLIGPKKIPLRITLLSPGGKPVQVTSDLPGFWANSYDDVRRDMRGRYPRHPWPDDPTMADPTVRAKPRGT